MTTNSIKLSPLQQYERDLADYKEKLLHALQTRGPKPRPPVKPTRVMCSTEGCSKRAPWGETACAAHDATKPQPEKRKPGRPPGAGRLDVVLKLRLPLSLATKLDAVRGDASIEACALELLELACAHPEALAEAAQSVS